MYSLQNIADSPCDSCLSRKQLFKAEADKDIFFFNYNMSQEHLSGLALLEREGAISTSLDFRQMIDFLVTWAKKL